MPLTSVNIAFQLLSLIVLGVYCLVINRYRAQAAECLRSWMRFRASGETEYKRPYLSFLTLSLTLGAVSVGLGTVKAVAHLLLEGTGTPGTWQWRVAGLAGTAGIDGVPAWVLPAAAVAVTAVVVGVAFAEAGVLRAAGWLTLSRGFTRSVVVEKRNALAAASLFVVPLVAVWSGANPVRDAVTTYILVGVVVACCVIFAVKSLVGFVRQKVSVLVWFLYLCGVEIFPICALALVAVKNI